MFLVIEMEEQEIIRADKVNSMRRGIKIANEMLINHMEEIGCLEELEEEGVEGQYFGYAREGDPRHGVNYATTGVPM